MNKTRIQIIDDNVGLTTLLAKTLFKFGYDPVVENNPLLAINTVRHYMPDLILLDIMMPERDGGRVLADLRADLSLRYIPVILLTAIAREAQTLADTGGITSPVLAKPVQLRELLAEIESQLAAARTGPSAETPPAARPSVPEIARIDAESPGGGPFGDMAPFHAGAVEADSAFSPSSAAGLQFPRRAPEAGRPGAAW